MNIVDIVLLGLLLIGAIRGFSKGIILEVAGLLGLFLALFGAFQLVDWGVQLLIGYNESINETLLPVIAFVILFVLILVGVYLLGRIVKAAFHITPFGFLDNLVGCFVGILKWALGISLFFWVLGVLKVEIAPEQMGQSWVFPYIVLLAPLFMDIVAAMIPYFQELLSSIEALFKQIEP